METIGQSVRRLLEKMDARKARNEAPDASEDRDELERGLPSRVSRSDARQAPDRRSKHRNERSHFCALRIIDGGLSHRATAKSRAQLCAGSYPVLFQNASLTASRKRLPDAIYGVLELDRG